MSQAVSFNEICGQNVVLTKNNTVATWEPRTSGSWAYSETELLPGEMVEVKVDGSGRCDIGFVHECPIKQPAATMRTLNEIRAHMKTCKIPVTYHENGEEVFSDFNDKTFRKKIEKGIRIWILVWIRYGEMNVELLPNGSSDNLQKFVSTNCGPNTSLHNHNTRVASVSKNPASICFLSKKINVESTISFYCSSINESNREPSRFGLNIQVCALDPNTIRKDFSHLFDASISKFNDPHITTVKTIEKGECSGLITVTIVNYNTIGCTTASGKHTTQTLDFSAQYGIWLILNLYRVSVHSVVHSGGQGDAVHSVVHSRGQGDAVHSVVHSGGQGDAVPGSHVTPLGEAGTAMAVPPTITVVHSGGQGDDVPDSHGTPLGEAGTVMADLPTITVVHSGDQGDDVPGSHATPLGEAGTVMAVPPTITVVHSGGQGDDVPGSHGTPLGEAGTVTAYPPTITVVHSGDQGDDVPGSHGTPLGKTGTVMAVPPNNEDSIPRDDHVLERITCLEQQVHELESQKQEPLPGSSPACNAKDTKGGTGENMFAVKHFPCLVQEIETMTFCDHLFSKGIINQEQMDGTHATFNNNGSAPANRQLLKYMRTKHIEKTDVEDILIETGQEHLLEKFYPKEDSVCMNK